MDKKRIDYSKTTIYKIICKNELITDLYVGHTTNFNQRKQNHKYNCVKNANLKLYNVINKNGGWDNWNMIKIAEYNCKDIYEAKAKEQLHYEELQATLNTILPCKNTVTNTSINNINHNNKEVKNEYLDIIKTNNTKYYCEYCEYKTCRLSQYNRHKLTAKHLILSKKSLLNQVVKENKCVNCNKYFKHQPSLSRHKKVCIKNKIEENNSIDIVKSNPNLIIFNFVKQIIENIELLKQQLKIESENNEQKYNFEMQIFQYIIDFINNKKYYNFLYIN